MKQNLTSTYRLGILDEIIAQQSVNQLSLNPRKTLATSFGELENLIVENNCDIQLIKSLRNTLEHILIALLQNFPENIFWDLDFLVSSMLRQALINENSGDFLKSFGEKIVSLTELCGNKTQIRFRYLHDFIYGFEWAKWVQKEPENRSEIEPFSLIFLDYLLNRCHELLQLISLDNIKYSQLSAYSYRNPFGFSREPQHEQRLLTYLAVNQLIPVAAWNWNASPVWNKPFHQMREDLSLKLNIPQI